MKKLSALFMTAILLLTLLTACGCKSTKNVLKDKSLEDIMAAIYEEKTPEFPLMEIPVDLSDKDAVTYYTGLAADETNMIKEALVSEAAIGSQAYSLLLLRLNDAKDAQTVATSVKEGINPRKWICVEADDMRAAAHGDVVMFIMVSSVFSDTITAAQITDAFKTTAGGTLSVDLK